MSGQFRVDFIASQNLYFPESLLIFILLSNEQLSGALGQVQVRPK